MLEGIDGFEREVIELPAVAEKLMRAEEFSALPNPPDGSRQELVKGLMQVRILLRERAR